jgi:hypothetical protein
MPGLSDSCGICRRKFPFGLPRCSMCRKPVCNSCGVRVGGAYFCSKTCGHTFFYGSSSDPEEPDSEDLEEE